MKEQEKTFVCPSWLCFSFDNFTRRWYQSPIKIIFPLVKEGDSVLDIGPGRGFFTFPLASLVKSEGLVYGLDIQKKMLDIINGIADKRNYSNIITHLYDGKNFCIQEKFDFINLFWMFHEVEYKDTFLEELKKVCKVGCKMLFAEPIIHVNKKAFNKSVQLFLDNGFSIVDTVKINISRAVIFEFK